MRVFSNTEQKHLQKATDFFRLRQFDKAIEQANHCLKLCGNGKNDKICAQTYLLLNQIYATLGKYTGETQHFEEALQHIDQADNLILNLENPHALEVESCLGMTYVYLFSHQILKAEGCLANARRLVQHFPIGHASHIDVFLALSQLNISKNNFKTALEYTQNAKELLSLLHDPSFYKMKVYHQLIQIYLKRQEYDNVQFYIDDLLTLSEAFQAKEEEVAANNALAILNGYRGNYKKAMEFFLEVLTESKAMKYRHQVATCMVNIATINAHLLNYDDAKQRYATILREYEDVLDENTKIIIYNNQGNLYFAKDNFKSALLNFEQALALAEKAQYKEMFAHCMAQISRCLNALGKYDESLEMSLKALDIMEKEGLFLGKQLILINIGKINFEKGDFINAIKNIQQGLEICENIKDETNQLKGLQILSEIYAEMKNFEKAYQNQLAFNKVKNAIEKEVQNRQALDLEIRYIIQEKQHQIEQLEKENQYQSILLDQNEQIAFQNEKLVRANEELQQFAYVVSHDLKEPLRMISSYTQLIYKRYNEKLDENSKPYFEFISEGVVRMNALLDALLQYAMIGRADSNLDWVDMNKIAEITLMNLKVLIEETNANIVVHALPQVKGIQSLMIQLFQNLIANALKFRKPNVKPTIEISAYAKDNDYIFKISDNGIGIEKEHSDRIFVIFQRLHARTKYEGTGIGLAICQKIVNQFGGKIWVESEPNEGCDFMFSFPIPKE